MELKQTDFMQPISDHEDYRRASVPAAASDLITALQNRHLTDSDIARIRLLIPSKKLDIHQEISIQNAIINNMKSRVLDENNQLLSEVSPKDISALIGSFNSFLTLYLRSMEKIDHNRESQEIETAILESIQDMPKDIQELYFSKLKLRLEI